MFGNWSTKRISEIILVNPKEILPKGKIAKKIPMDILCPFCRDVPKYELAEYSGGAKFRNGDTIMARITPCLENGKTAKVSLLDDDEVGFGSTEYIVFRAMQGITDENFVYYLVCSPLIRNPAIKSMVGSSGRQRVQTNVLQNLEIALPDLETQKRIGSLLRSIDDRIAQNTAINENLEQQAQAIFKSWFLDSSNEERKTCRADEYFDISIGKTPPRKEHQWFTENPDDIVWVSISDMGNCGMFIEKSSEYLTRESVGKFNIKVVPPNTVLLSFKLTVGRVAIAATTLTTNEAIAHFMTDNTDITEYLYCYLKQFNYQSLGSTSSIAVAVNSKIIKDMPFIIPTDDEIANFHALVSPMFTEILKNQHENQHLAALRDTLLPKLMNGEIDVSNINI